MKRRATFYSSLSPCEYLPDRQWRLRYDVRPDLDQRAYAELLHAGWRRIGPALFRPECPSCRMCLSLRVPVEQFTPSTSQRRVWKRNVRDMTVRVGAPSITAGKAALFARFHDHGHATKGWPGRDETNLALFLQNPFPTEEWTYYAGDRLVGVGYVDALATGLSAIYFFHEPEEKRRSLGTFNVLALIASARQRQLPHVYLGYYVRGCRSLEYKARFRPHEVLGPDGAWHACDAAGQPG